jgi:hypothetical protein
MDLEKHCGVSGCICTHTLGCDKGWILGKFTEDKVVKLSNGISSTRTETFEGVSPCPMCDPDRYEIFITSKTRLELFERLRKRGTHQRAKAYDEDEKSKTRTL